MQAGSLLLKKKKKKPHAGMVVNLVFSFISHIYMVTWYVY